MITLYLRVGGNKLSGLTSSGTRAMWKSERSSTVSTCSRGPPATSRACARRMTAAGTHTRTCSGGTASLKCLGVFYSFHFPPSQSTVHDCRRHRTRACSSTGTATEQQTHSGSATVGVCAGPARPAPRYRVCGANPMMCHPQVALQARQVARVQRAQRLDTGFAVVSPKSERPWRLAAGRAACAPRLRWSVPELQICGRNPYI